MRIGFKIGLLSGALVFFGCCLAFLFFYINSRFSVLIEGVTTFAKFYGVDVKYSGLSSSYFSLRPRVRLMKPEISASSSSGLGIDVRFDYLDVVYDSLNGDITIIIPEDVTRKVSFSVGPTGRFFIANAKYDKVTGYCSGGTEVSVSVKKGLVEALRKLDSGRVFSLVRSVKYKNYSKQCESRAGDKLLARSSGLGVDRIDLVVKPDSIDVKGVLFGSKSDVLDVGEVVSPSIFVDVSFLFERKNGVMSVGLKSRKLVLDGGDFSVSAAGLATIYSGMSKTFDGVIDVNFLGFYKFIRFLKLGASLSGSNVGAAQEIKRLIYEAADLGDCVNETEVHKNVCENFSLGLRDVGNGVVMVGSMSWETLVDRFKGDGF